MSTIIKNNKEYYPFWLTTIDGPKRGYYLIGDAPIITRFDRALKIMKYYEDKNRTLSKYYDVVRKIAIKEMFKETF
jgi:predicted mannosyl-3-phosphoglycerate phosphatase (HAD superfamily)